MQQDVDPDKEPNCNENNTHWCSKQIRNKGKFSTSKKVQVTKVRIDNGKRRQNSQKRKALSDANMPSTSSEGVPEGERICDLAHIAKEMFCKSCNKPLHLQNIEQEKRVGYGSIFSIRCPECLLLNYIDTGERYKSPDGFNVFKRNTTAVLAGLHTGQGHSQQANALAVMNIPKMSQAAWKRHERYLQPGIQKITRQAMEEAIAEERKLTLQHIEELKRYLFVN